MGDKVVHENLVSIDGDKLRVELGPRRVKGTATPALLRATGRRLPGERFETADGKPRVATVVYDALGEPVTLGKPMTYLDKNPASRVWYRYRWETVETDDGPLERFVEKGTFSGARDDAVAECRKRSGGAS